MKNRTEPPPVLWTRQRTAKYFGVNLITIDRWIASGKLQSTKVGRARRIPEPAISALVEAGVVG